MEHLFSRGFLSSKTSNENNPIAERRYNFFETRSRIIEKIGGYKNFSKIYRINGIIEALRLAKKNGLRQSELDQLLQKAEKIKNDDKN